jgi:hypothetical protein
LIKNQDLFLFLYFWYWTCRWKNLFNTNLKTSTKKHWFLRILKNPIKEIFQIFHFTVPHAILLIKSFPSVSIICLQFFFAEPVNREQTCSSIKRSTLSFKKNNSFYFLFNISINFTSGCLASSIYFAVVKTNEHNSQCTLGRD